MVFDVQLENKNIILGKIALYHRSFEHHLKLALTCLIIWLT